MQFRLHINNTNDGSKIAAALRKLASQVDGHPLNHGFTRQFDDETPGYATMQIEPTEYDDCATAERELGATLDWHETSVVWEGRWFGQKVAIVKKVATPA